MENFYKLEQKIVEFKFSMKISASDSLELAKLILRFTHNYWELSNSNIPHNEKCVYYALMSVLKKILDKKDKKNYTLKLNGSEYYALSSVLEYYHTKLLGDHKEAYTWIFSQRLLEKMA
ncbi:hypothetical protein [Aureispira sp. CCB-QB1]|uniref:hypothetical protein n=1 Tax=Aureispira sp. CCB-QB1 TaxID=1313421 RepID=UPI000698897F|nr:hypothetical protein [Aureispira sp. CCB-QB1]